MYTRQIVRRLDRIRQTCLEIAVLLAKQEAHVKNRIAAHKAHHTMKKRKLSALGRFVERKRTE